VLMPGEPEARREAKQLQTGLPITSEVLASLQAEAQEFGIALPEFSLTPFMEQA